MIAKTSKKVACWVFDIFILTYCMAVIVPWDYRTWLPPCNNSWVLTLHEALIRGCHFGTDIVFTFGPLGFLYYGITNKTVILVLAFWSFFAIVTWLGIREILKVCVLDSWWKKILSLFVIFPIALCSVPDATDAKAFLIILIFILISSLEKKSRLVLALYALSLGLLSLIKFSWFIPAFFCILLTESGYFFQKRIGVGLLIYITTLLFTWLACKQTLFSAKDYFINSWEVASTYQLAMPLTHEATAFSISIFVLILVIWIIIFSKILNLKSKPLYFTFTCLGSSLLFWFVVFKAGYVRNDFHELVSSSVLASAFFLILPFCCDKKFKLWLFGSLGSCVLLFNSYNLYQNNPNFDCRKDIALGAGYSNFLKLIEHPKLLTESFINEQKSLQKDFKLLSDYLQGKEIDIFPFGDTAKLILSGVNYKPRPVFESYSCYSSKLQNINSSYIEKNLNENYIILGVTNCDSRFPTLDDSTYFLRLIISFDYIGTFGNDLLLERVKGRMFSQVKISSITPKNSEAINVPTISANEVLSAGSLTVVPKLIICKINIPLSFWGKLLSFIYKVIPPTIDVVLTNGDSQTFQLPITEITEGFLLSPAITSNELMIALFKNDSAALFPAQVKSITIHADTWYRWDYANLDFLELVIK
jgi:hypothetical protein